jgi:hypothetical protein
MAKREGRRESQFLLHHMQIRVAYARATDPDHNLPWPGRRLPDALYLSRTTDTNESDGLHRLLPSAPVPHRTSGLSWTGAFLVRDPSASTLSASDVTGVRIMVVLAIELAALQCRWKDSRT